ncbi:MAG TPA: hypothetical protein VM406_12120 [Noviherbaspirillum sp.]|nr:hypothetical protein [Noviherbaspirillum sp.]
MAQTLIRMFREIGQAQQAREALLAQGFAADQLHLEASEDEAGAAAGNFVLPRKDSPEGAASGVDRPPGEQDAPANSQAMLRGQYILTIEAGDDAQCARAAEIVDPMGAVDVDRRSAGH